MGNQPQTVKAFNANLPQPVNTGDFYLEAIHKMLVSIGNRLESVENEIALLKTTMQSQPKVVIDAKLIEKLSKPK